MFDRAGSALYNKGSIKTYCSLSGTKTSECGTSFVLRFAGIAEKRAINKDFRVNELILRAYREQRIREVRLIDEDGQPLGIIGVREALETAKERGLDLIEVAPTAQPPVCRIMDYGKYKYEIGKKERDQHKKQKQQELKELKMSPRTQEHDFQVRKRRAIEFLQEGDKVKLSMLFKAREITHPEIGRKLMDKMLEELADYAVVIKTPSLEGKMLTVILNPKP